MPGKPRMYMAGVPCHVILRGNNREACFFTDDDYLFYLECLKSACDRYLVCCHAYVLMTNHTHLLLSPEKDDGISKVMSSLGRRYVQYINKQYRRSGTLWESRHKASVVDADNYLISCYRYIELNPVMANMVEHQGDYSELFNTVLTKQTLHEIRTASSFSMPRGNSQFKSQVELMLKRSIGFSGRGRPENRSCVE